MCTDFFKSCLLYATCLYTWVKFTTQLKTVIEHKTVTSCKEPNAVVQINIKNTNVTGHVVAMFSSPISRDCKHRKHNNKMDFLVV